jgi:hypothetical protein
MPTIDNELDNLAQLRNERELPKCIKSSTDREEPNRAADQIDVAQPTRKNARNDRELPRWRKSKIDIPDPYRTYLE